MKNYTIPAHERIGLSRSEAAEYIGVSATTFDILVVDGRMPVAKTINSRKVWHRLKLERAFADLPDSGQTRDAASPWGDCAT